MTIIYYLYDKRDAFGTPVYIGSTDQPLSSRKNGHISSPGSLSLSSWIHGIGENNVGIERFYECDSASRQRIEQMFIDQYRDLGCKLLNINKAGGYSIESHGESFSS